MDAMAPLLGDYMFCFLFLQLEGRQNNLILFNVSSNLVIINFKNDLPIHLSLRLTNTGVTATPL